MPTKKCGMTVMWFKNFIKNWFSIFVCFLLPFLDWCFVKLFLKRLWYLKKSYSKTKYFLCNQVSHQFHFIISLGNWDLKLELAVEIQVVDKHKTQQTVQVLFHEVKV